MAAVVNLTEAYARAQELARVLSEAMPEDAVCPRELALSNGTQQMLRPPVPVDLEAGRAMWAGELLILLEDGLTSTQLPDAGREAVLRAIARVQEALGVPEEQRAWLEDDHTSAPGDYKDGPQGFASIALSVLPSLRTAALELVKPENRAECKRLFDEVADRLQAAYEAAEDAECVKALKAAEGPLCESANLWGEERTHSDDAAWALQYGIRGAIRHAVDWVKPVAVRNDTSIGMLPGEHGERGALAIDVAVEIAETARAVLIMDESDDPNECTRVKRHLIEHMRLQAGVIMSCLDGDDTMKGLYERAGQEPPQ